MLTITTAREEMKYTAKPILFMELASEPEPSKLIITCTRSNSALAVYSKYNKRLCSYFHMQRTGLLGNLIFDA